MKTDTIHYALARHYQFPANEFDDGFYNPKLQYSLRHLAFIGDISNETLVAALKKSLQICYLANINSKQHFKQVYLFDETDGTLRIDCFMSKNGFNLMLMQIAAVNEKLAVWLWKLSEL
jgi:hypothetical protein